MTVAEFCDAIKIEGIIAESAHKAMVPKFEGVMPRLRCRLINGDAVLPGVNVPPLRSVDAAIMKSMTKSPNERWSLHCKYPKCNSFFSLNELRKSLPDMVVSMLQDKLDQLLVNAVEVEDTVKEMMTLAPQQQQQQPGRYSGDQLIGRI